MAFFIADACVDVMDRSCIEECPVDCIYEGDRKLYINPQECIDCGACEPVCPVSAISAGRRTKESLLAWREDNAAFFAEALPGRQQPLGTPGSAVVLGPVGVDTPLVRALPEQS